jgi:mgtE-like transporter
MSTIADIFITLCYVVTLSMHFNFKYAVVFISFLSVTLFLYILHRSSHQKEFVKTIKESLFTLIFVAFIVNITGAILNKISLEGSKQIFTVYPALINTVGDVGSVVGSTTTTKLTLGLLTPSFSSMRNHVTQIFSAWMASVIIFVLFSPLTLYINNMFTLSTFLDFTSILLITNIIAVSAVILISHVISILTFRRGLDPDNFVIPLESSLADSITSIALLAALFLTG